MPETHYRNAISAHGDGVVVTQQRDGDRLHLVITVKEGSDCVLHWGMSSRPPGAWHRPPEIYWPEGTTAVGEHAVRTPFSANGNGRREVVIRLDRSCPWRSLPFVVHFPHENRWLKDGGRDFHVLLALDQGESSPEQALAASTPEVVSFRDVLTLDSGDRLAAAAWSTPEGVRVRMICDADLPVLLHWGVAPRFPHEWTLPSENHRPAGTTVVDSLAVRTPFAQHDGLQVLDLEFRKPVDGPGPRGLKCVLFQPSGGGWLKRHGSDLFVPLFAQERGQQQGAPQLERLAEPIVGAEMGAGSWTLMHRFNLCHDLLDGAREDPEAMALLFVWLRYSATRQLDWQRRYNTKPGELSHAQDRLTTRLAGIWRHHPPAADKSAGVRTWARWMLTTLGRGGDGQRVRDEILQIMHRNHVKEVHGLFLEEWHQKLHNNTTPDDIVICEAYLEFLKTHGDRNRFYHTLESGGVTRERLRSFERPIRSDPEYYADRRDALLRDFENFLRTLKAVHAGTDLESAIAVARGRISTGLSQKLDAVFKMHQRQSAAEELAGAITAAREELRQALGDSGDDAALRDLLMLDLALEGSLRGAIERQDLSRLDRGRLVDQVYWAMRNSILSIDSPELVLCTGHWAKLKTLPQVGRDWTLHAKSIADRATRVVQLLTNDLYRRLQPKAESLGNAFKLPDWTVSLFSDEVIRGGPAFALALLLSHMAPALRQAAGLGGWQVISPAPASGRVRVVERLADVQNERFPEATILIAAKVAGTEEIPAEVKGVITLDAPDLLSHVAVRARNAEVLFATCFEPATYERLQRLSGGTIALRVTPGGDIAWNETTALEARPKEPSREPESPKPLLVCPSSSFVPWAITQDQFRPEIVGGKSNNLNRLRGRLLDWIHLPASLALPFGSFEKSLDDDGNRPLREKYAALVAEAEQDPIGVLPRLRTLLLEMLPPASLKDSLLGTWRQMGLPSIPWENIWHGVVRVWASKWNERAFFSRRARGILHEHLKMAVLVQQVVEADYAYVIHTVNPLNGNHDELYAEVVLGLGETLVGNYPGRSLGVICRKIDLVPHLISYPGKSVGLFGKGVIFRSDSNGEDLEKFAGAGLYDSFLAEEPEQRLLDYRGERLMWDQEYRNGLLRAVAQIGLEVERVSGAPQDVEGAIAGGTYHVVQTRPQVGLSIA